MIVTSITITGQIAHVRLAKSRLPFKSHQTLAQALDRVLGQRLNGVIVDLTLCSALCFSELGTLIDILIRVQKDPQLSSRGFALGVCGLDARSVTRIKTLGLCAMLPVFENSTAALSSPSFKAMSLRGIRAVIYQTEGAARLAPMSFESPVTMLDFLGKPIISRIIDHAGRFGIADYVTSAGQPGSQVQTHLSTRRDCSVFYVTDGHRRENDTTDAKANIGKTLVQMHNAHGVFHRETIVMPGNAVGDIDLAAMMAAHIRAGVDATVAMHLRSDENIDKKNTPEDAHPNPGQQITGIAILNPDAIACLERAPISHPAGGLYEQLLASDARVGIYNSTGFWLPIRCGLDYFSSQAAVLNSPGAGLAPTGEEIRKGIWADPSAQIGRSVTFENASFVSANALIKSGAVLKGNCVIGADCTIEGRTVLNNSLLRQGTRVEKGAFVENMIAGPRWAVNHTFADGSLQNQAILEGTSPAKSSASDTHKHAKNIAKIA
jgi:NDP-sugar pyrophosphorylase family protein